MKTFTFNGYCPLIDRQMPVKTLPYDGKCVWGVHPQGGTWHQHTILSNSPENYMKSMVYALNIFFSKVPAAKILHETSSRMSVADLRGGTPSVCPPTDQNFLNFMQFFRKLGKNYMLVLPTGGLVPPPMEILDLPLDVYRPHIGCNYQIGEGGGGSQV